MFAAVCCMARLECRLHALGPNYRNGRRSSEEFDQLLRRVRHFCVRADARSKHDVGLYLRREWADEVDAGGRQDLSDDHHTEFDVALSDKLGDNIGFRSCDLRLDRLGNSEAFEQASQINAASDSKVGD